MPVDRKSLPRTIRGGRPLFFDDPAVDKLVSMLLALSGEVWVLRERLAAIEGVAGASRAFTTGDVESYEFSAVEAEQLARLRQEFIGNLFRVLDERVQATHSTAEPAAPTPPRGGSNVGAKTRQRSQRASAARSKQAKPGRKSTRAGKSGTRRRQV